jgi:hypothetical protein
MNREQLAHALRAASAITGTNTMLVVGSQSILGSFPEHLLPEVTTRSAEIDIAFFNDPQGRLADQVEGAIGEDTDFERTFGFYVDGVDTDTATLPHGWWNRLVIFEGPDTNGAQGQCLEPHDCVVSKLAAGRDKDLVFSEALIRVGLVHPDVILERINETDMPEMLRQRIRDWIAHIIR